MRIQQVKIADRNSEQRKARGRKGNKCLLIKIVFVWAHINGCFYAYNEWV